MAQPPRPRYFASFPLRNPGRDHRYLRDGGYSLERSSVSQGLRAVAQHLEERGDSRRFPRVDAGHFLRHCALQSPTTPGSAEPFRPRIDLAGRLDPRSEFEPDGAAGGAGTGVAEHPETGTVAVSWRIPDHA